MSLSHLPPDLHDQLTAVVGEHLNQVGEDAHVIAGLIADACNKVEREVAKGRKPSPMRKRTKARRHALKVSERLLLERAMTAREDEIEGIDRAIDELRVTADRLPHPSGLGNTPKPHADLLWPLLAALWRQHKGPVPKSADGLFGRFVRAVHRAARWPEGAKRSVERAVTRANPFFTDLEELARLYSHSDGNSG